MIVLLPVLLAAFGGLAATRHMVLRTKPGAGVDRSFLPAATAWVLTDDEEASPPEGFGPHVLSLFARPDGEFLSLNDLMLYKLKLHYPTRATESLNDLLNQFRLDHP